MNDSKLPVCHICTLEPAVRVCRNDMLDYQYCSLLLSLQNDCTSANVVWALLHDHADAIMTKTSSRRIAGKLGIPPRTSALALTKLLSQGLLVTSGRSYFDIRYQFDCQQLLKLWQDVDLSTLPVCFADSDKLDALCESWDLGFENNRSWIILLCQLGYDYPLFAVLSALIRSAQDDSCVVSLSCLALADIVSLPSKTVHRKLLALEEQGLIERLDSSSRTACFRVCLDVLRALLSAPLPEVDVLPGITPLPALQRLFPATPTTGGSQ